MRDYVNSAALQEYTTKLVAKLKTLFPGTPTAAATVADMIDHSKTYVYVGSETGYTAGDWYYWDGSAWTSGGPFQATSLITDTTLAVAGEAADAKATGDAIAAVKAAVLNAMAPAYSTSGTYAVGDYVNHNGAIYRCTTAITTGEAWTAGHWAAVTLGADLDKLKDEAAPVVKRGAGGGVARFADGAGGRGVLALSADVKAVQSGSGAPSPGNVRPISGFTGAVIRRTGKNLVDYAGVNTTTNGFMQGNEAVNGKLAALRFKADTRYTVSISYLLSGSDTYAGWGKITFRYTDGTSESSGWLAQSDSTGKRAFASAAGKTVGSVQFTNYNANYPIRVDYVQVEEGAAATEYEPYAGEEAVVGWETEAGEVYGGSLNVLTGELTVTWTIRDLGTATWVKDGGSLLGRFHTSTWSSIIRRDGAYNAGILCSQYAPSVLPINNVPQAQDAIARHSTGNIYVVDHAAETLTAAQFKAMMSGVMVAFQLAPAEYRTYQLTPAQLTTLLGENNVWADTGDVTVEYAADTKLYVDAEAAASRAMIAEASGPAAARTYAAGEFLTVGGTLYKATAAITSGETITPGGNVTATTVGEELTAIYRLLNS